MSYHETLEQIEHLTHNNIDRITTKDIAANLNISERAVSRSLKKLAEDNKIERIIIRDSNGTTAYYKIKTNKETEGVINEFLTNLARLLH